MLSPRNPRGHRAHLRAVVATLALPALAGCGAETTDQRASAVVYGSDNRLDVYAHPDTNLRHIAQQSIVALMDASMLDTSNPSDVQINASTLGRTQNLCSGQRFYNDPAAAFCSGTLVDDDVVITAGHCITSTADCDRTRFVFNYYRDGANSLHTITTQDVFACRAIIAQRLDDASASPELDYAVIRLDRSATPRFTPASVQTVSDALADSLGLAVIGFGSGIPAKIDSGGAVRNSRSAVTDYFTANTDTFGGNSGSGVFDRTTYKQVGILVRGDTDYVDNGGCNVVNVCDANGCRGESSTYVYRAVSAYCATGATSLLCGNVADSCGDGRCTGSETSASCASDCPTPSTSSGGDGGVAPGAWSCDPSRYNDGTTCDCECGAEDPDCMYTDRPVNGCATGEYCNHDAHCSPNGGCAVPPRANPASPGRERGADYGAVALGALAVFLATRLGRRTRA